jgi:SAM-dependent methyltransferase
MRTSDIKYQIDLMALRTRRFTMRRQIQELTETTLAAFDRPAFIERFRPFWDPFPTIAPCKFLNLEVYVREAAFRAFWPGAAALPRSSRVLDLGCGAGYFLVVCRQLGLDVLGLDLDDEPLYNEMMQHFGLNRVVHAITPGGRLPDLGESFDLVTAFMTCFDRHEDLTPWTGAEWNGFLTDLRSHIKPGGKCVILFNRNPVTGECHTPAVRQAIASSPGFRASFFHCYLTLNAV